MKGNSEGEAHGGVGPGDGRPMHQRPDSILLSRMEIRVAPGGQRTQQP